MGDEGTKGQGRQGKLETHSSTSETRSSTSELRSSTSEAQLSLCPIPYTSLREAAPTTSLRDATRTLSTSAQCPFYNSITALTCILVKVAAFWLEASSSRIWTSTTLLSILLTGSVLMTFCRRTCKPLRSTIPCNSIGR